MCVNCVLRHTDNPSKLYSRLTHSVPGNDSGPTVTLTRIKRLLKMNERQNGKFQSTRASVFFIYESQIKFGVYLTTLGAIQSPKISVL